MSCRALLLCLALLLAPIAAIAGEAPAAEAARGVITAQIEAMKQDDSGKAFSFAAPEIQAKFGDPETFMAMVRGGYGPVYKPRAYQFGQSASEGDTTVQIVEITAADGGEWLAEYRLRLMPDGSVRISGCRLMKREGVGA